MRDLTPKTCDLKCLLPPKYKYCNICGINPLLLTLSRNEHRWHFEAMGIYDRQGVSPFTEEQLRGRTVEI